MTHAPRAHDTLPAFARLSAASKAYAGKPALSGVDLQVRPGEMLALLGANGAGKSTTLGMLCGRLRPDQGRAELFGGDPCDPRQRRGLGMMLQEASLPDTLTVAEQIRLYSGYYPNPRPLQESLALADIADLATRRYGALSGGQQRRVQFALALCGRAPLLCVDEPSAGLDVSARRALWRVLAQLRDEGAAIVLTTHYLEEADTLADRIVVLAGGKVVAEGRPAQIKARVGGSRVRARSGLAVEQVRAWPGVLGVAREGECLLLRTADAAEVLRHWLAADPGLAELEVRALGLEDAFLDLVGSAPTQAAAAWERAA